MFQVKRIEKGKKEMKREEGEGTTTRPYSAYNIWSPFASVSYRPKETIRAVTPH